MYHWHKDKPTVVIGKISWHFNAVASSTCLYSGGRPRMQYLDKCPSQLNTSLNQQGEVTFELTQISRKYAGVW